MTKQASSAHAYAKKEEKIGKVIVRKVAKSENSKTRNQK